MSTAGVVDTTPITSRDELAAWMEAGAKPPSAFLIGTEHEKFGFRLSDRRPLPYDGDGPTVRKMLEGLADKFGWEQIFEDGAPVALRREGATIALEPGGQFELSGAPLRELHQTCAETGAHLREVKTVADEIGAGFLGIGATPDWALDDMPRVPKARYGIMANYMPQVGRLGREMMFRTCTIQVNLDFSTEADMVKKLRVAIALQPLATALFANSPLLDGRETGWLSYRAHVWSDTDPDRTGMLPFVFQDGFGFERYVDWAIDAPMYFLRRDGRFVDVAGQPFRKLLERKLPGFEGQAATLSDWEDHLSTLFPEARVKRFIETRGADGGPWSSICALPAFWVGLLYDDQALDAAWSEVKGWTDAEREGLRLTAPKLGLRAPIRNETLQDLALRILAIARGGLARRARLSDGGQDETGFLDGLDEIAASGDTPAEILLAAWRGSWNGDLARLYETHSY